MHAFRERKIIFYGPSKRAASYERDKTVSYAVGDRALETRSSGVAPRLGWRRQEWHAVEDIFM